MTLGQVFGPKKGMAGQQIHVFTVFPYCTYSLPLKVIKPYRKENCINE
jgi:hypothetical protein|tara:strand:+ start:10446 stop:10589 length:144 start_codon:yes stop_codon:yes gene_type:complete